MPVRVAINGLGRVGRCFLRSAHGRESDIEVVAVNDLVEPDTLAHLVELAQKVMVPVAQEA